jgi:cytochrome c peroxidase
MNYKFIFVIISTCFLFFNCSEKEDYSSIQNEKAALGKAIFFDENLSNPIGKACVSCHSPEKGFSDPLNNTISEGALFNTFGNRNAPSLSYNVFAPNRYYNTEDETFVGGLFLDGRSPNLQEQFIHPMLNPLEMNNTSTQEIVLKIKQSSYYSKIVELYSNSSFESDILSYVADALMNYETSKEVNPFTSKYDYYLQGRATLSTEERKGLVLFEGKAKCAECHITEPDPIKKKVLFTDFTYDNIGVPRNPNNPFYTQPSNSLGSNYIDFGIGIVVSQSSHNGKFKVPTLRNTAISAPYFHNGAITTLEKVVQFYNKRDLNTGEFDAPETSQNLNVDELGNLELTDEEENNIVAFLKTLTDGYHKP